VCDWVVICCNRVAHGVQLSIWDVPLLTPAPVPDMNHLLLVDNPPKIIPLSEYPTALFVTPLWQQNISFPSAPHLSLVGGDSEDRQRLWHYSIRHLGRLGDAHLPTSLPVWVGMSPSVYGDLLLSHQAPNFLSVAPLIRCDNRLVFSTRAPDSTVIATVLPILERPSLEDALPQSRRLTDRPCSQQLLCPLSGRLVYSHAGQLRVVDFLRPPSDECE
jgi:hypothetical protein